MIKPILAKAIRLFLHNKFVGVLLFAGVCAAVLLFAINAISSVDMEFFRDAGYAGLLLPFGLILLAYLNRFLFWIILAESFDLRSSPIRAGYAFFYSILGRYVPGKAGLFLIRLRGYEGKSKRKVGAALITEYISTVLAASMIVIAGSLIGGRSDNGLIRWVPIFIAVLALLALHPRLLKRMVNSIIGLAGKKGLPDFPGAGRTAFVTAGQILTGLLHGMALFLILRVFTNVSFALYPVVTGAYYAAGLVGIFAFFSPGGLGVREGMLFVLLSGYVNSGTLVIAAAAMRLLTLMDELILTGVFRLLTMPNKKQRRSDLSKS